MLGGKVEECPQLILVLLQFFNGLRILGSIAGDKTLEGLFGNSKRWGQPDLSDQLWPRLAATWAAHS